MTLHGNPEVDRQVVETLRDFCNAVLATDCNASPNYAGEYEYLYKHLLGGPFEMPKQLSDMFVLVTEKWHNKTLTIEQLGVMSRFVAMVSTP